MSEDYNICENCQKLVDINVGQAIFRNKLVWNLSYKCKNCGFQLEEDGDGFPPKSIRNRILEMNDTWNLCVFENTNKAIIIKVIRQALQLNLKEASQYIKRIPGCLMTGTKLEMDWLSQLLQHQGISAKSILKPD